jgi:hypothetical protein
VVRFEPFSEMRETHSREARPPCAPIVRPMSPLMAALLVLAYARLN